MADNQESSVADGSQLDWRHC